MLEGRTVRELYEWNQRNATARHCAAREAQPAAEGVVEGDPSSQVARHIHPRNRQEPGQ